MPAVIAFDFDPFLHFGDGVVRWETLGIAVAIFVALVLAGIGARTMELRADDLLFVVLGTVPGAVIGGRLGYVVLNPAFFAAQPARIIDPGKLDADHEIVVLRVDVEELTSPGGRPRRRPLVVRRRDGHGPYDDTTSSKEEGGRRKEEA